MGKYTYGNASIDGLDELVRAFKKLPDEAGRYVRSAANQGADMIKASAASRIRTSSSDKEHLRNHLKVIKSRKSKNKPDLYVAKVTQDKGFAYAKPLEFGHRLIINGREVGMVRPYPFMRQAVAMNESSIELLLVAQINKAIEKFGD